MIKRILLGIILVTIGISLFFFWDTVQEVAGIFVTYATLIPAIIVAIIIQLVGHVYRARRTKLVLDQAAPSSLRFQVGTLSIGYLFNAVFPLRVGEFIRAYLVARRLRISFLYTLAAVLIERAIDIIFLGVIIAIFAFFAGGVVGSNLLGVSFVGIIAGVIIIAGFILLKNENQIMLRVISSISRLFNTKINNSIRFKVWSLIFGLQNFFDNKEYTRRYISYAIISWVSYILSTLVIVVPLLSNAGVNATILTTISSYAVGLPSLVNLSHQAFVDIASLLYLNAGILGGFDTAVILWAVLTIPIAVIGLLALAIYGVKNRSTNFVAHPDAYTNKLLRYDDISQDFPAFLETYFKGYGLSRVLHKIEVHGELSLVKFFKGGSDAITVLALKDGKLFVKKIVPAEYTSRLKVQYEWLKKFENKKSIVTVLDEQETEDYYAIDLEYNPTNISLFEYVHTHSLEQSKIILDKVWAYVFKNVYTLSSEKVHTKDLNAYVEDRLINKMKSAIAADENLRVISEEPTIKINGQVYDNFYQILNKIKTNKVIWKDLATYRGTKIAHGDMTIDNILVNAETTKPFIIDPSDDNQVRGPIIDFARHMQSLIGGYEFLNNDEEPVYATREDDIATINYHDRRSARYMELSDYVTDELSKKYFTEFERKAVLFHVGLLYGRMLAHRVVINPDTTLKYYAVSVQRLNEFYQQYN